MKPLYHVYLCPTDGPIILKTPAIPVFEGNKVVLYCQYWTGNHSKTAFFKNGAEILAYSSSSSDRAIAMTIENVTQEHEGFYKCASHDRRLESPESWLSVRPDRGQLCSPLMTLFIILHFEISIKVRQRKILIVLSFRQLHINRWDSSCC